MTTHVNAPAPAALAGADADQGPGTVPPLFHFTCGHFHTSIRAVGALIPHRHPYFPTMVPVVWLTTAERPDRWDVGLTSDTLDCDRLSYRFAVTEARGCLPWMGVAKAMAKRRQPGFDAAALRDFHAYGLPHTWWISPLAVPVVPA